MHKVCLTSEGVKFARERTAADMSAMELYPDNHYGPGNDKIWTVADDIATLLLTDHIKPVAVDESYGAQLQAVVRVMSAMQPRAHIASAFKQLCRENLIECDYNLRTASADFAEVFSALGNPIRWTLMSVGYPEPVGIGTLCRETGREPAGLYHHITVLERAGLMFSLGHGQGYLADLEYLRHIVDSVVELLDDARDTY